MSCLYDIDSGWSSFDPRVSNWNIHSKEEGKKVIKELLLWLRYQAIFLAFQYIARRKARFIEMTGLEAGDE